MIRSKKDRRRERVPIRDLRTGMAQGSNSHLRTNSLLNNLSSYVSAVYVR